MDAPQHITDEQVVKLGLAIEDEVKGHSAIVRPGDTIIVFFDFRLDMQQYDELKEFCKTVIPGVNVLALPEVKDLRVFRPTDSEGM
jgi:Flp pilus assembly protein CpaB